MGTFGRRRRACVAGLLAIATALTVAATGGAGVTARHARAVAQATSLPTWRSVYDWQDGDGYAGWHAATTAADDYGTQAALAGGPGLWL